MKKWSFIFLVFLNLITSIAAHASYTSPSYGKNQTKIASRATTPAKAPVVRHTKKTTKRVLASELKPHFSESYIRESIELAARKYHVSEHVLAAICTVESDLTPTAFKANDGGEKEGNHAFGLCQVLIDTAEGFSKKMPGCHRNFAKEPIVRNYKECPLFGPRINADLAAKILSHKLDMYKGDYHKAVAAYNAGSFRLCKSGVVKNSDGQELYKCKRGGTFNEKYVVKVLKKLQSSRLFPELLADDGIILDMVEQIKAPTS